MNISLPITDAEILFRPCPCCGQPISSRDPGPLVRTALNDVGRNRALAEALLSNFGEWVSTQAIIENIYGADPPRNARKCVNVFAYYARQKLQPFGLIIRGRVGGHKHGGYRLEWLLQ